MEKYQLSHVSYCNECKKYAYPSPLHPQMWENCSFCGGELEDTGKTSTQLDAERPSRDELFMTRMLELKETDPVKYEIAMAKYNQKLALETQSKIATQMNIPKCPICNSPKIHKISLTNKAGSIALFGIFSAGHVSKTFKCDNCGAKF